MKKIHILFILFILCINAGYVLADEEIEIKENESHSIYVDNDYYRPYCSLQNGDNVKYITVMTEEPSHSGYELIFVGIKASNTPAKINCHIDSSDVTYSIKVTKNESKDIINKLIKEINLYDLNGEEKNYQSNNYYNTFAYIKENQLYYYKFDDYVYSQNIYIFDYDEKNTILTSNIMKALKTNTENNYNYNVNNYLNVVKEIFYYAMRISERSEYDVKLLNKYEDYFNDLMSNGIIKVIQDDDCKCDIFDEIDSYYNANCSRLYYTSYIPYRTLYCDYHEIGIDNEFEADFINKRLYYIRLDSIILNAKETEEEVKPAIPNTPTKEEPKENNINPVTSTGSIMTICFTILSISLIFGTILLVNYKKTFINKRNQ